MLAFVWAAAVSMLALCAAAQVKPPAAPKLPPGPAKSESAAATPQSEAAVVSLASAAFDFRDFKKVIAVLRPWTRPMKILDPKRQVEARRLMGVSLHLLGKTEQAEEEFGELLLLDPDHKLDPFKIPPNVVQSFERIRRELKPTLDKILADRGKKPPPPPPPPLTTTPSVTVARVPHWTTAWLPLGLPQFVLERPGFGWLFAGLQVAGYGTSLAGWILADRLEVGEPEFQQMVAVMYTGAIVGIAAYVASVIHGNVRLSQYVAEVEHQAGESARVALLPIQERSGAPNVAIGLHLSIP